MEGGISNHLFKQGIFDAWVSNKNTTQSMTRQSISSSLSMDIDILIGFSNKNI